MAASLPQGRVSLSVLGAVLKCRVGKGCEVGLSLHGALSRSHSDDNRGVLSPYIPALVYSSLSLSLGHSPGQQSETSVVLGTCSGHGRVQLL